MNAAQLPARRGQVARGFRAAREQHGELRVFIQHRLGRLEPGEASILIGVASAHRRAALEDLTGSASEAGLYDEDADRYRQALRQARRDLGRQAR